MWVLFGVSYETVENEPFVYFIGVFDNEELAKIEKQKLDDAKKDYKKHLTPDYFIKPVVVNQTYSYDWCNEE